MLITGLKYELKKLFSTNAKKIKNHLIIFD